MKCLRFTGMISKAQQEYNTWAKGKPLARDVIVHTHQHVFGEGESAVAVMDILVFYDESLHTNW